MAFLNKIGSCNMTGSVDIVANSISLIKPDGSLQELTLGGTIAPVNNPQFTGTVQGVTKDSIGLGNVDNTSDLNKPVSTATQNALNTVISNTNTTLTSQLGLINTNTTRITSLTTSTSNTFASQLTSINNNASSVSSLNTSVNSINATLAAQTALNNSVNNNITTLQTTTNTHTTNLSTLNTSVSNINSTLNTQLGLINTNTANLSNLVTSTNNTIASQLSLINGINSTLAAQIALNDSFNGNFTSVQSTLNSHTTNLSTLNTSVSNINSTLTSQLGLINTNTTNLSNLVTSTNNTFASQLSLINANKTSINGINSTLAAQIALNDSVNGNFTSIQNTLNIHTTNLSTLNTSVSNINSTLTSQLGLINTNTTNLSNLVTSTNNTFASQLALINNNTSGVASLNTSVSSINQTILAQIALNSSLNTNQANQTTAISTLNTSVANINVTLSSQLPTYATTAYVNFQVSNLVGAAPAYLDTLAELSNAISNNSNFATTIINSIGAVANTANTTLTTTYSILNNTIPTLATNNYVNSSLANYQPLYNTNTLANLPVNVVTSNFYFDGFPNDQPAWVKSNSANYTNMIGSTLYQTLTFPSTSAQLLYTINTNSYSSQASTLSFSMQGGTASTITVSLKVVGSGTVLATNTLSNISFTTYTNFNIPFTSPGLSDSFFITLTGATGNCVARNWNVFAGTSVNTQIRGNLSVPYGNITTSDLLYGATANSLITAFSNLSNVANTSPSGLPISTATQTALNNKLNTAAPTYTGMLSNANSNFQVDNTGIVSCLDVKYNGGTSLTTSVSNINTTISSQLPTYATTAVVTTITSQKMSNTNPAFVGILSGNDGFQVDSSNNLRASGWVSCGSLLCAGQITGQTLSVGGDVLYGSGATSLTNTISTLTTSVNNKANLSGASFTGAITTSSNLSVGGSYGAWAMALLSGNSYAVGTVNMTWASSTTSNNISHTASTDSFQVSQAGTYFIGCYITSSSTGSSGVMQLIGRYSTNGTTWSNVLVSTYPGSTLIASSSTVFLQGLYQMAANSYFDVQVYNGTPSTLTFYATVPNSYFYMYRIG